MRLGTGIGLVALLIALLDVSVLCFRQHALGVLAPIVGMLPYSSGKCILAKPSTTETK